MDKSSARWTEVNPSHYPWEREALAFVRDGLPDSDPYCAWANVEFISDNGAINELDLLVVSPFGFFLVEIKSHPGIISGDQQKWNWVPPDVTSTSTIWMRFGWTTLASSCASRAKRMRLVRSP